MLTGCQFFSKFMLDIYSIRVYESGRPILFFARAKLPSPAVLLIAKPFTLRAVYFRFTSGLRVSKPVHG